MAYEKTTWVDRLVQFPRRFKKSLEAGDSVTLTPDPGTITEPGTMVSAAAMNKIEQGIADAHDMIENITVPVESVNNKTGAVVLNAGDVGASPVNHTHSAADVGAAPASHNHSADDINAGTLPVTRGGTGATTVAAAKTALQVNNVDNVKQMPIAGGTFTGVAVAQTNTSYTTRQLRNVVLSTANPSGGSNGDLWFKYK